MSGWIKIYRSTLDNPFMCNADVLGTWVYILMNVTYQPEDAIFEGKRITLQPGQGVFKIRQMAKVLGISHSKLHRYISRFKSEAQIETQSSPRSTIITVVNWDKYQVLGTQDETQTEHKRNTSGTQNEFLPIKDKEIKNIRNNINNNTNVLLFVQEDLDEEEKNGKYKPIIEAWNSLPVTQIRDIKGKRLDLVRARVKEYGIDGVLNAIEMVRKSPFLLGQNKKSWQIVFDWFVRPNNFPKVLEGNYSRNRQPVGKNDVQAGYQKMMDLLGGNNEN